MGIEDKLSGGFVTTTTEWLFGLTREWSVWPVTFGLACCAFEMMSYAGPRFDSSRWGQEVFRASPRQSDLMIISGRVSQKMAPIMRRVYDQMPDPKWVIAMGACSSSGGVFNNYAIVQGADHIVPVDLYIPGCPPRPDMLIDASFKLRAMIAKKTQLGEKHIIADEKAKEAAALAGEVRVADEKLIHFKKKGKKGGAHG